MAIHSCTSSLPLHKKKPAAKLPWKLARSKRSAATVLKLSLLATAFLATAHAAPPVLAPAPLSAAELILKNGRIFTDPLAGPSEGNSAGPFWSESIAIRDGIVFALGSNRAVDKERGPATRVIDLKGKLVLPGFNDAHLHILNGGLALLRADLRGVSSVTQLQERLKAYSAENPTKKWLLGQGWEHTLLPNKKYPTKDDLDAAVPDRPVLLWHADHHALVLNTRGLEALHISSTTVNPTGGEILKNDSGEPTGVLLEEAAFEAEHKVDNPTVEELKAAFLIAQDLAVRAGITSIQGGPIRGEEEIKALEEIYNEKKLRVHYSLWGSLDQAREFLALKEKYKHLPDEWLKFDAVKGFVDGVLSTRTAALTETYADDPHTRGEPLYTQEKLSELVLTANRLGLPVAFHAIGDKAVSMSMAAASSAKHQLFNSRVRNRIEHIELAPPYVYAKFAENHVVASMQPAHMLYETEAQAYTETRLGPVRSKNAFAFKSFLSAGAHLAFGSDWPVETLNPLVGIYAAVTRQHYDGKPTNGWQPSQKLTVTQAIDAYTLGPAWATREDHVKGTIREGKYADLVVLDRDIFKIAPKDLLKTNVVLTISGGKVTYDGTGPELKASEPASAKK